jgi:hypothetical protein
VFGAQCRGEKLYGEISLCRGTTERRANRPEAAQLPIAQVPINATSLFGVHFAGIFVLNFSVLQKFAKTSDGGSS